MKSFAKGIDPDVAEKELEKIETEYGGLTAEILLEASKAENTLFHCLFEWDDNVAAEKYRLQQARTIINNIEVTIISDGEPYQLPVYEIVQTDENGGRKYKHIETLTLTEIDYVKEKALELLIQAKTKLKRYSEFAKVIPHIDNATNILTNICEEVEN